LQSFSPKGADVQSLSVRQTASTPVCVGRAPLGSGSEDAGVLESVYRTGSPETLPRSAFLHPWTSLSGGWLCSLTENFYHQHRSFYDRLTEKEALDGRTIKYHPMSANEVACRRLMASARVVGRDATAIRDRGQKELNIFFARPGSVARFQYRAGGDGEQVGRLEDFQGVLAGKARTRMISRAKIRKAIER
jgi:hypothetical protein